MVLYFMIRLFQFGLETECCFKIHFRYFSSGENNPKTDEPEPDMAAYMAPLLYNSFYFFNDRVLWKDAFLKVIEHAVFPFAYRMSYNFFQ